MTARWHLAGAEYERLASVNEINLATIEHLRRRLLEAKGKPPGVLPPNPLGERNHWVGKPGEFPRVKDSCGCEWCADQRGQGQIEITALGDRERSFISGGPFTVLDVDTPASREADRQRAEYEASPQSVIDALAEYDAWMLAGGVWAGSPEPEFPPELPQADPPRSQKTAASQPEPISVPAAALMLSCGLVLIALSVHLFLWLAACGLALIISAFILGRR